MKISKRSGHGLAILVGALLALALVYWFWTAARVAEYLLRGADGKFVFITSAKVKDPDVYYKSFKLYMGPAGSPMREIPVTKVRRFRDGGTTEVNTKEGTAYIPRGNKPRPAAWIVGEKRTPLEEREPGYFRITQTRSGVSVFLPPAEKRIPRFVFRQRDGALFYVSAEGSGDDVDDFRIYNGDGQAMREIRVTYRGRLRGNNVLRQLTLDTAEGELEISLYADPPSLWDNRDLEELNLEDFQIEDDGLTVVLKPLRPLHKRAQRVLPEEPVKK